MGFIDWLLGRGPSDPRRTTTITFRQNLTRWLLMNNENPREARRFLEQNLDLLRPESEQLLTIIIHGLPQKMGESFIEVVKGSKTILRQAAREKTPQAVRDAYIDEYSALRVLDLPPWLASIRDRISLFISLVSKYNNTLSAGLNSEAHMKLLVLDAISRVRNDRGLE